MIKNKHSFILTFLICITLVALFIVPPSLTGCLQSVSCTEYKWGYSYNEFDQYFANLDNLTPSGIKYDPSGQNISPYLIDRLTKEVEDCLGKSIDRNSFGVKIANDWVLNCDKTEQVLPTPVKGGYEGCINKGLTPSEECPCRWRAGIQCPNILIVTPNFYLYKDVLIRFVMNNYNPWQDPHLAECASPSTTPLSDGSDPNNGL